MELLKLRMWNAASQSYLYDIDNVFECLKQQHKFDGTMPDRGFVAEWDHKSEGMKWELFSEFKDIHNKQICEGDIVKYYRFLRNIDGYKGIVSFRNGCFVIRPGINIIETYLHSHLDRLEIIGNINENPELL